MPKAKEMGSTPLAEHWSPPARVSAARGQPLFCVASTYTFHAPFFEEQLLPCFLGLRFDEIEAELPFAVEREEQLAGTRVCVLVDASHVDARQSTLRWDQLPVRVEGGYQHSKVALLGWADHIRLIVSSANLTRSGYTRNREIAAHFDFFDDAASAPRRLLRDVFEFLSAMEPLVQGAPAARGRMRDLLETARELERGWQNMPFEFAALERPRAVFVPVLPRLGARPIRSALDRLLEIWGSRKADQVYVMTPFVGDTIGSIDPVVQRLTRVPHSRDVEAGLVVPGVPSERDANVTLVGLPSGFRDSWARSWRTDAKDVPTFVVPRLRSGDKAERDLHAKAVLIIGDGDRSRDRSHGTAVLLCGSSNFSPHGMGVGAANIEANVCFVDDLDTKRGGLFLDQRLPVDWDEDRRQRTEWQAVEPIEDEQPGTHSLLPRAFLWATYNQRECVLILGIDLACPLPAEWSFSLTDRTDAVALPNHQSHPTPPASGRIVVQLPPSLRGAKITALRLSWTDEAEVARDGLLAVQVERDEDLLPLSDVGPLSPTVILDALLSGRDLAEWVEARQLRLEQGRAEGFRDDDALRAVDTRGYLLYRTRRLGAGLSVIAERLFKASANPKAVSYLLMQHPWGPAELAASLVGEWRGIAGESRAVESSAVIFSLVEINLTLAHISKRVGTARTRALFAVALERITALRAEVASESPPHPNLQAYVDLASAKSADLIGPVLQVRRAG